MLANTSRYVRFLPTCLFLVSILLVACSSNTPPSQSSVVHKSAPSPTAVITGPTTPGLKNCQPASPMNTKVMGGPEIQGTAMYANLWILLESSTGVPPQARSEVKIVWKMTGSGQFTVVASGPRGMRVSPSQGPAAHLGSSWNRVGDEWGTVFTFPVAGCWDLHATRGKAAGDVWLTVVG